MLDLVYPSSPAPLYPRPSVDNPGRQTLPAGEMLPLVEPSGLVYGQASREWCHSGSHVLHPVVHLHVSYGESIPEALFRETSEELGLSAFNPVRLCTYVWETERDSEFVFVHAIVGHPTLRPNAEEVSEGRWWSIPELEEAIGKNILTPNFESEFQRIKDQLLAML